MAAVAARRLAAKARTYGGACRFSDLMMHPQMACSRRTGGGPVRHKFSNLAAVTDDCNRRSSHNRDKPRQSSSAQTGERSTFLRDGRSGGRPVGSALAPASRPPPSSLLLARSAATGSGAGQPRGRRRSAGGRPRLASRGGRPCGSAAGQALVRRQLQTRAPRVRRSQKQLADRSASSTRRPAGLARDHPRRELTRRAHESDRWCSASRSHAPSERASGRRCRQEPAEPQHHRPARACRTGRRGGLARADRRAAPNSTGRLSAPQGSRPRRLPRGTVTLALL